MYIITHNIDNVKSTILPTDAHLVHFVRKIAVENEDEELSITVLGEALDYLNNYCPNLTLTTSDQFNSLPVNSCQSCPFAERIDEEQLGDGQYICNEIHRQKIEWVDKDGFDDYYRYPMLGIPTACPLKKQPTIICLDK
jgi:hypothetical protein